MKTIIALRGIGNSGKTTTINLLHRLMIQSKFIDIGGNFGMRNDFWTIFEKKGKKVGITSWGDNVRILKRKIDILNREGCLVIVCACRSYGDTVELIEDWPGFQPDFILKP